MKKNISYWKYRIMKTEWFCYFWDHYTSCYIACRFVLERKSVDRAIEIIDRWNRMYEYKSRMQYRRITEMIAEISRISGKPEWEIRSEYGL